jgi:hypothetical protein
MPLWPADHFSKWIKVTLMLLNDDVIFHFVIG